MAQVIIAVVFDSGEWWPTLPCRPSGFPGESRRCRRKQQRTVHWVARSTMHVRYDLQTGAVTVDCARLDWRQWTARLVTRPVSGWRLLVHERQVVSTAMFTAPLTVREQLQTAWQTAAADLAAAAHLCDKRPDVGVCCSSSAWQHAPQVLHEVAVDGEETLTVSVRLHGRVDEKRLQFVCRLLSVCLTHRPNEPIHFTMYILNTVPTVR